MARYNNNSYDFNYDLGVVIKHRKTNEVVVTFNARENAPVVNDAGFEAGGIASGGQNYSIATDAEIYDIIKPYEHQAVVDGVEYKVLSKNYSRSSLRTVFGKKNRRETVIYLG